MIDLKDYVDALFRHQRVTPEVNDLKEEILSNMIAKRDDLIAQGLKAELAAQKAMESVPTIDYLLVGSQLTDLDHYYEEAAQTVLRNCIVFWICSLPLLFTHFAMVSYLGLILTIISGSSFMRQRKRETATVAYLSVTASQHRQKIAWLLWGLFFVISIATMIALTFASDLWFGRPLNITGPYQMANIIGGIYLPLLMILVPLTFRNFTKILIKNSKENEHESEE